MNLLVSFLATLLVFTLNTIVVGGGGSSFFFLGCFVSIRARRRHKFFTKLKILLTIRKLY